MNTPNEILLKAAEHMEKVGFHQGGFYKRGEDEYSTSRDNVLPCCARGAMEQAAYTCDGIGFVDAARQLLVKHLGLVEQPNREPIANWNDEPGRTKEEVIAALRGAAALGVSQ